MGKIIFIISLLFCSSLQGQDVSDYPFFFNNEEEVLNQDLDSLIDLVSQPEFLFDDAVALFELAEQTYSTIDNADRQALIALEFGRYLIDRRFYEKGLVRINKALLIYTSINSLKELMLCYKYLGNGYNGIGKKTESVTNYDLALNLAYDLQLLEELARIKNNIGIVYLEQSRYDKAIQYFESSLEEDLKLNIRISILGNLGLAESKNKNYSQSEKCYLEALGLANSIDDHMGALNIQSLLASLSFDKGDFQSSLLYTKGLVDEYKRLGLQHDLLIILNLIGLNYTNLGEYEKAVPYYRQSIDIGLLLDSREVVWMYANIAFNEASAENFRNAYENLLTHLEFKDSLFSVEKNKQIEEALAKYETEKKEKEIVVLEAQKELQARNLTTQKLIRNIIYVASAIIAIILIVFIINYAQKLKNQKKLGEQQELINNQKILKLLKDNEIKTIRATINGQEEERIRLAKELHDGVAGSIAGIKFRLIKHNSDSSIIEEIDKIYNDVRDLSHGLTSLKVAHEPLVSLIKNYIQSWNADSNLTFELIVSQGIDFDKFEERLKIDLYRIVQELITNVFTHANATYAELQITKNKDGLNIMLEDNGIGFDDQKSVKGIGVRNVKHRVDSYGGDMFIDSVLGRGTIVNIDLPIDENVLSIM